MHYRDNQILIKRTIGDNIKSFRIYSPAIAEAALPGQFVILRLHEKGERFPLTLCDWDKNKGWIQLVVQEVGKSTRELGMMGENQVIVDILGPLGKPAEIEKWGKVICVAGGVGTAEMYPIARAMQEAGNEVIGIIGFRSEKQVILQEELKKVMKELFITTEDGSVGIKGLVTHVLEKLLKEERINLVYSVGPLIMMKVVSEMTREFAVPTVVSLNPIMVDG
ncbi:MAG: sulfide/dihydroorotate dehydrogenase-like FAD/NAD-binding protein, partial [Caldiserica bacterium]|nr:sulfide/dihydroorotate dehydrogenase-like FAD/NAD-binding protein [Caldisericota bacterium]